MVEKIAKCKKNIKKQLKKIGCKLRSQNPEQTDENNEAYNFVIAEYSER